eukprot:jgi/Chlat1/7470/Chrsp6S07501
MRVARDSMPTVCKFSGLRIKILPQAQVEEDLSDMRYVKLQDVKTMPAPVAGPRSEWATMGVIVHKLPQKVARNGTMFGVWKLSLLNEVEVALFLFDGAFKQHWKEREGSVVVVLEGALNKQPTRETVCPQDDDVTLRVDRADQVEVIGLSADFGRCKGARKDGEPCRNTSRAELLGGNLARSIKQSSMKMHRDMALDMENYTMLAPPKKARLCTPEQLRAMATAQTMLKNNARRSSVGAQYLLGMCNRQEQTAAARLKDLGERGEGQPSTSGRQASQISKPQTPSHTFSHLHPPTLASSASKPLSQANTVTVSKPSVQPKSGTPAPVSTTTGGQWPAAAGLQDYVRLLGLAGSDSDSDSDGNDDGDEKDEGKEEDGDPDESCSVDDDHVDTSTELNNKPTAVLPISIQASRCRMLSSDGSSASSVSAVPQR